MADEEAQAQAEVHFALAPALISNEVIDYSTSEEAKIKALEKSTKRKRTPSSEKNTTPSTPRSSKGPQVKPEWMTKPPKEGEKKEKQVNKKTYYWCKNHQAWVRHKPSECKGKGYTPNKDSKPDTKKDAQTDEKAVKKLKLAKGLAAILEDDAEDSE